MIKVDMPQMLTATAVVSRPTFWDNPSFRQYESLLLQLHALIRADLGDTPEAENISGQTAEFWRELSDREKQRFKILSSDLHMLGEGESFEQASPSEREPSHFAETLKDAWQREDW